MRIQISAHLQNRAKTIRTAIATYNKAADSLTPPRPHLKASEVLDMVFLAQFDLLRYSRPENDIRNEPWAHPRNRVLTDKYFELLRAKEEIQRLNVEWRRLGAWLADERSLYLATINSLRNKNQLLLASVLQDRWRKVERSHFVIRHWLRKTEELKGFTGDLSPPAAVDRELGNSELLSEGFHEPGGDGLDARNNNLGGGDDDDDEIDGHIDNTDLLSSMIDTMGRISF